MCCRASNSSGPRPRRRSDIARRPAGARVARYMPAVTGRIDEARDLTSGTEAGEPGSYVPLGMSYKMKHDEIAAEATYSREGFDGDLFA